MANVDQSTCCVGFKEMSPKQRRVIHSPICQLQEELNSIISDDDKYMCTFCFAKLNWISKIDNDIGNGVNALRKEKS